MMRVARSLVLFALVPVFAGCQMFSSKPADTTAGQTRLQGELVSANDQLIFQPCVGQQRYAVRDSANTTLVQDATDMPNKPGKLFADIRGNFIASKTPGTDGEVQVQQLYRLERNSSACQDRNFKQLTVHANGNGPAWEVQAGGKGMVLKREGQPDLALPTLKNRLEMAASPCPPKPTTSASSCGWRRNVAPTVPMAACSTWAPSYGSTGKCSAAAVILVARVTTDR